MNLLQTVKNGANKLIKTADKHSPEILIGVGLVGFVSALVMVNKVSPVAKERLDDLHDELGESEEEITKKDILVKEAKIVVPLYLPATMAAGASTLCVLAAFKKVNKRTAALATAYELANSRLADYQKKMLEELGEKKANKVLHDISQEKVTNNPPPYEYTDSAKNSSEVVMTDGLSLFYDPLGGRYFRSSIERVRHAEKVISERLPVEMYISLNDLYYELELPYTKTGDMVGFTVEDGIEIIFNSCLAPDMTPCTVMEFCACPRPDGRWM